MPPSVGAVEDLVRHRLVGLQAEGHGAEREARHGEAGAAEAGGGDAHRKTPDSGRSVMIVIRRPNALAAC